MGGFNRWTHKTQIGPMEMTPPDIPAQYDAYGNEVVPGIVRSGSPAHWKVSHHGLFETFGNGESCWPPSQLTCSSLLFRLESLQCTFTVPHDAYKMDFVFSDVQVGCGSMMMF